MKVQSYGEYRQHINNLSGIRKYDHMQSNVYEKHKREHADMIYLGNYVI